MTAYLQQFHFLRPEWLLALIPLLALLALLVYTRGRHSGWQHVIPVHLYKHMVSGNALKQSRPPYSLLALGWLLATLALAGPTWERLPQPVFQLKRGHVVLIDMSLSMRATDVSPDRLTRAKYKAIDLINALGEGETGLVAYAGDAFVISPLTQDVGNITSLLPSLRPEIMPVAGSDPLLGFEAASELLTNAGYQRGDIYWITDGIEMSQMGELKEYVSGLPFTVNVLGVGTPDGAPIRQLDGELLKDSSGSIVVPRMREDRLDDISKAGNGKLATLKADDSDIERLTRLSLTQRETETETTDAPQGDAWREAGPYLLLLLLPLAAYGFRRGLLFALCVACLLPLTPSPVMAQQPNAATPNNDYQSSAWWQQPFLNDDQEAKRAYDQRAFDRAASQFTAPAWQGAAHYRAGNFDAALEAYNQLDTNDALYNQGNALARLGRLDEAIERYDRLLERAPDHEDAAANKALLEQLKKQQQNNQEQQQGGNGQDQQQSSDSQQGQDSDQQDGGAQNNGAGKQSGNDNAATKDSEQDQDASSQSPSQQENGQPDTESPMDNGQPQQSENEENAAASGQPEPQQGEPEQAKGAQSSPADDQPKDNQEADATGMAAAELTDEEKEAQQRLDNLMRRVPDDPAFLLKRKMQLEAQKRQRQRLPANRRDW